MTKPTAANVVEFPSTKPEARRTSSTEAIWGKAVAAHGYAGIPSILIRSQGRLGLSPMQFNIIVHLLEYWRSPERRPFPTKRDLAQRMGASEKAIQNNIKAMEERGFVRRERRKTAAGDWDSNVYHLDGLVAHLREKLEPDFAKERDARQVLRKLRTHAELAPHKRRDGPRGTKP